RPRTATASDAASTPKAPRQILREHPFLRWTGLIVDSSRKGGSALIGPSVPLRSANAGSSERSTDPCDRVSAEAHGAGDLRTPANERSKQPGAGWRATEGSNSQGHRTSR